MHAVQGADFEQAGQSATTGAEQSATDDERMRHVAELVARIDRLPACWSTWAPAFVVSTAAIFEIYDLYQTAYVPPGLIRSGIFSRTGVGLFGLSDQALFAASTFLGLFVGATCFSSTADRLGRRTIFLYALLGYSAGTALVALQSTALGVDVFRFLAGIGLGVSLVTVDAFLVELTPAHMRGRVFAILHVVMYLAVPTVAFLAWWLIPLDPLGIAGWRWVVLFGCTGALLCWWLQRLLPESPRWLALQGRGDEAERTVAAMEARVTQEIGRTLPPPGPAHAESRGAATFRDIWLPPYTGRTIMLIVFNFFQTIGFFGFTNWLPALLSAQGHGFTNSLFYSFCIAWAYPITPIIWGFTVAERFERKWLIVAAALGVACAGPLFAIAADPALVVTLGIVITGFSTLLSLAYHPYQAELFPTEVRARAVGFVYSFSRLSTALTSFLVAFFLNNYGTIGVFALISFSMLMVMLSIGVFGPPTRGRSLEEISS